METYSGPHIRQTLLYNKTGSAVWYNGFDFLNPRPAELFNDAAFTPKMLAVAVVLSEEILNNQGTAQLKTAQLKNVMKSHIKAAEGELEDVTDASIHSNGSGFGGKELGGFQLAIPTVTNTGTYGGTCGQRDLADIVVRRQFVRDRPQDASDRDHGSPDTQPHHDAALPQQARRRSAADVGRALCGL